MQVHHKLGFGFMEKVYENAMMVLLRREGIGSKQQAPIPVYFEGEVVGDYFVDILIEYKIILELKTSEKIVDVYRAQILNYLKATGIELGMIFNFGKKRFEYERFVL